jgi:hypothetical protein
MRRGAKSKGFVHLGRCNRESDDLDKHLKDFEDFIFRPWRLRPRHSEAEAQLAAVARSSEAMAFL